MMPEIQLFPSMASIRCSFMMRAVSGGVKSSRMDGMSMHSVTMRSASVAGWRAHSGLFSSSQRVIRSNTAWTAEPSAAAFPAPACFSPWNGEASSDKPEGDIRSLANGFCVGHFSALSSARLCMISGNSAYHPSRPREYRHDAPDSGSMSSVPRLRDRIEERTTFHMESAVSSPLSSRYGRIT